VFGEADLRVGAPGLCIATDEHFTEIYSNVKRFLCAATFIFCPIYCVKSIAYAGRVKIYAANANWMRESDRGRHARLTTLRSLQG
jgi:hypothetical protein